jgi:hypothetical protein
MTGAAPACRPRAWRCGSRARHAPGRARARPSPLNLPAPTAAPPSPTAPPRWCPHCRHFKPIYENASAFCAVHTPVRLYRVDCVDEVGGWGAMWGGG